MEKWNGPFLGIRPERKEMNDVDPRPFPVGLSLSFQHFPMVKGIRM